MVVFGICGLSATLFAAPHCGNSFLKYPLGDVAVGQDEQPNEGNQFIFGPFWNFQNGHEGFDDWEVKFNESKSIALKALQNKNTLVILEILFDRLYTLRNQILHGGATWNGKINRSQVQDGQSIIGFLVPNFLQIMMDNQNENWGKLVFPVVES